MSIQPTSDQSRVIHHSTGPLFVVAGPGAGKTHTLVERIVELLKSGKACSDSLLVISFTDKAAREIRSRVTERLVYLGLSANLSGQQICTFHALCHRLISENRRHTRLGSGFRLMDDFEQRYFVYRSLYQFNAIPNLEHLYEKRRSDKWHKAGQLCKWINKVTEEALNPSDLLKSGHPLLAALGEACQLYQSRLHQANALDLPGLQTALLTLFKEQPEIATSIKRRFSHVMVDEYQDTNTVQELILLRMLDDHHNLCVVGDDDQGLYRFRGASVQNLLDFPLLFPGETVSRADLGVNYRSHPRIVHFCHWWIGDAEWEVEGRSHRLRKQIEPRPGTFDDTPTVIKVVGDQSVINGNAWTDNVIGLLEKLRDEGGLADWNQVAFLFRSVRSNEAQELSTALENHGIPVHSPRSRRFFDRHEIQLVIGAVVMVFAPLPGLGADTVRNDHGYYRQCSQLLRAQIVKEEHQDCLTWLTTHHAELTQGSLDYSGGFCGFLYELLRFPLFGSALQQGDVPATHLQDRVIRNLALLSSMLSRFDEIHDFSTYNGRSVLTTLDQFLNHYLLCLINEGINEFESETDVTPSGFVPFLTIHQAKGLQFPVVVCGSMDATPWGQEHEIERALIDRNLLHKPPGEPADKVAEYDFKRLYYTAFSRAQNLLVLSVRNTASHLPTSDSPFQKYLADLISWDSDRFEADQLNLATVKKAETYQAYSLVADIHLYENCPRKFRYFRELGFAKIYSRPDALGRLVRETLNDIHRHLLDDTQTKLDDDLIASWLRANSARMSNADQRILDPDTMKDAQDLVESYAERLQDQRLKVIASNQEFKITTPSYAIETQADFVRTDDGRLAMRVFRGGSVDEGISRSEDLPSLQAQRQIDLFATAASELMKEPVGSLQTINVMMSSACDYASAEGATNRRTDALASIDATVKKIRQPDYRLQMRPQKLCDRCVCSPAVTARTAYAMTWSFDSAEPMMGQERGCYNRLTRSTSTTSHVAQGLVSQDTSPKTATIAWQHTEILIPLADVGHHHMKELSKFCLIGVVNFADAIVQLLVLGAGTVIPIASPIRHLFPIFKQKLRHTEGVVAFSRRVQQNCVHVVVLAYAVFQNTNVADKTLGKFFSFLQSGGKFLKFFSNYFWGETISMVLLNMEIQPQHQQT